MLNLSGIYWNWKAAKLLKLEELRKEQEEKKRLYNLYGKYIDQAEESKDRALYCESEQLTELFIKCIDSGINSVVKDKYHAEAVFENGYKVKFWIENKMYAYAKSCVFTSPEGKEQKFGDKTMPKFWCCYMILDKIENFQNKA